MFEKIEKKHQKRLAKLTIALLERSMTHRSGDTTLTTEDGRVVRFDMKLFFDAPIDAPSWGPKAFHECGTACCFIGFAPDVFPDTRSMTDYNDVLEYVTGDTRSVTNSRLLSFLFHPEWTNEPKQAAARALVVLKGIGALPDKQQTTLVQRFVTYHDKFLKVPSDLRFYRSYTKKRLIQELSKFL